MMPFNYLFNMNYIYSSEIPANIRNLYPFIEHFPPFLTIEVTGLIIAILLYQLIRKRNKELDLIALEEAKKNQSKTKVKPRKKKKN